MRRSPLTARSVALGLVLAAPLWLASPAAAQEDPSEPTGRAVCHLAFTAAAAISFGGAGVPPSAPAGPNDVVVVLTPLLRTCAERYPLRPQRECIATATYPRTGLPVTPPDPVGIGTEQAEAALVAVPGPLGMALAGPLRDVFASALRCELGTAPPGVDGAADIDARTASGDPVEVAADRAAGSGAPAMAEATGRSDQPLSSQTRQAPIAAVVSRVPKPLRGAALVLTVVALSCLGALLRRQLAPRRHRSLLDATTTR